MSLVMHIVHSFRTFHTRLYCNSFNVCLYNTQSWFTCIYVLNSFKQMSLHSSEQRQLGPDLFHHYIMLWTSCKFTVLGSCTAVFPWIVCRTMHIFIALCQQIIHSLFPFLSELASASVVYHKSLSIYFVIGLHYVVLIEYCVCGNVCWHLVFLILSSICTSNTVLHTPVMPIIIYICIVMLAPLVRASWIAVPVLCVLLMPCTVIQVIKIQLLKTHLRMKQPVQLNCRWTCFSIWYVLLSIFPDNIYHKSHSFIVSISFRTCVCISCLS